MTYVISFVLGIQIQKGFLSDKKIQNYQGDLSFSDLGKFTRFCRKIDILASIASDHSPGFLSIKRINDLDSGPGYWKFNNSLLQNNIFCDDLREMLTAFNIKTQILQINRLDGN